VPIANSGEVREGYIPFFGGGSEWAFRKKNCSTQWAWEQTCGVLRNYVTKLLWTEPSGHKTHGFSVGNKKWFETSI